MCNSTTHGVDIGLQDMAKATGWGVCQHGTPPAEG